MSGCNHQYPLNGQPLDLIQIRSDPKDTLKLTYSQIKWELSSNFEALIQCVLMGPLHSKDTQVEFNLISVEV